MLHTYVVFKKDTEDINEVRKRTTNMIRHEEMLSRLLSLERNIQKEVSWGCFDHFPNSNTRKLFLKWCLSNFKELISIEHHGKQKY